MKPPLKFSIYAILYMSKDGIWEHEIYGALKKIYNKRSLSKVRSILIEMQNKSWTNEVEATIYDNTIIRKYKLQDRHREFIKYHLSPEEIIKELEIDNLNILLEGEQLDGNPVFR